MINIQKFQRHPTDPSCVILHYTSNYSGGEVETTDVANQEFRDALEAAGKLED